jgi:hypothetical protein
MFKTLWSEYISVYDNFLDPDTLALAKAECRQQVAEQGVAFDIYNLIHQDTQNPDNFFQIHVHSLIDAAVREHCENASIDYDNLFLRNSQLGFLHKFDEETSKDAFHEAHHDMVENAFVNPILYIESDFGKTDKWVGGELILYKDLSNAQCPKNTIRVNPVENRLVIFSAYNIHRVNPYCGDNPRTALITCYGLNDLKKYEHIII